jgi:hypothetical protein
VASVVLQSSTAAASSTSGSAASGQCAPHEPAYQLLVEFQPLPSSAQIASASTTQDVSKTSGVKP